MKIIPKKPVVTDPAKNQQNLSIPEIKLPTSLAEKQAMLKPHIERSIDIVNRSFIVGGDPPLAAAAIFINGIIDLDSLNRDILRPLMFHAEAKDSSSTGGGSRLDQIAQTSITVGNFRKIDHLADMVQNIYDGMLILLFEGLEEALVIDIHDGEYRAIDEPTAEKGLRGSREGFIENLDINISLIRRRLRDPKLVVKKTIVGKRSRTQVAIIYVEDIADPQLVTELQTRIDKINTDAVVASGMIEQMIEDNPYSLFSQFRVSEKPDKAVMQLLEGRIIMIIDGTPTAILTPSLFVEFFQSPGDYFERTFVVSCMRMLRYLAFFISVSFPALYVALLSFQPELIPSKLLVPLAQARNDVPFPAAAEILFMEIIMQLLIEAGLYLPGIVGQTVGVVAGVVMGQAAIIAKLASPGAVIIVAMTTMSSFALPSPGLVLTTRVLRFPMIILAATFGTFGFSWGWIIIITHLAGLKSMGIPYLAPLAPTRYADLKDTFYRTFLWKMKKRPVSIPSQDKVRQGE